MYFTTMIMTMKSIWEYLMLPSRHYAKYYAKKYVDEYMRELKRESDKNKSLDDIKEQNDSGSGNCVSVDDFDSDFHKVSSENVSHRK